MQCADITETEARLVEAFGPERARRWLEAPHPLLDGKSPSAAIAAGGGDLVREIAEREVAHDAMDWVDWRNGNAIIKDEAIYEAELTDGTSRIVVAEVHGAEDGWLQPADDEAGFDEGAVTRIRWLGDSEKADVRVPASTSRGPALLFDAAAAWQRLDPERQAAVGVAAIVHVLGAIGSGEGIWPLQGFEAADMEGLRALEGAARDHLPGAFVDDMPLRPDLSAIGVHSCRVCGCTDDHACPGGCGWAEPGLCSACAPAVNSGPVKEGS